MVTRPPAVGNGMSNGHRRSIRSGAVVLEHDRSASPGAGGGGLVHSDVGGW